MKYQEPVVQATRLVSYYVASHAMLKRFRRLNPELWTYTYDTFDETARAKMPKVFLTSVGIGLASGVVALAAGSIVNSTIDIVESYLKKA